MSFATFIAKSENDSKNFVLCDTFKLKCTIKYVK